MFPIQSARIPVKNRRKNSRPGSGASTIDQELETLIEKIAVTAGGDELLARIFAELSAREREILWGYMAQTDSQELGFGLDIEMQTANNYLALIEHKLGFESRPELLRRVFSAIIGKLRKS